MSLWFLFLVFIVPVHVLGFYCSCSGCSGQCGLAVKSQNIEIEKGLRPVYCSGQCGRGRLSWEYETSAAACPRWEEEDKQGEEREGMGEK